uniref:Uncharacterized protein n=1 Tax=Anopheles maculatus TaxID=74869 RepID=A0A182SQ40_9DIPT
MDVDPVVNGSEKAIVNPSPKFDLSTEQFSRILEATVNQRRTEECSKSKAERTYKVKTTTYRFTPTTVACQVHRQQDSGENVSVGGGGQNASPTEQHPAMGGRRSNTTTVTTAGGVDQSLASGASRNWSRFNFNLNLQYTASSYNSAARAVAAAIAAVHSVGTSSAVNRARTERTRNDLGNSGPSVANDRPSLPRLVSVSQTVRMVRSAGGSQQQLSSPQPPLLINTSDANGSAAVIHTEPTVAQQVNRPSLASLPPAAQRLYAIMNYISLNNHRQPAAAGNNRSTMTAAATNATPPLPAQAGPLAENDPAVGLDFNGVITPEIADKIVAYLIVNLRSLDWVANVFRSIDGGGANDPELRVNNLLELLRQLGVRMEACNGQIVIRAEQTRDRLQFLSLLLRIAGYNDKYFHQRSS